tara:strand:+ start:65 stop:847 length:783 start_codon:yes stop_codon:yes gene_type:complete
MKQLNKAFREMSQDPENNDARLNYYGVLADTDLFLLLEQEPSNEILEPKFIQLEGNNFALAFDSEENLSEFYGEAAAFAQITGRVLAKMLLEEKIGLGINLGVSEGELLLPYSVIEWFVSVLEETPDVVQNSPKKFLSANAFPEIMLKVLQEKLEPAVGLFDEIWICGVEYDEDEFSNLICLIGAQKPAEQAMIKSIKEVLSFSDINLGNTDVTQFNYDDEACSIIREIGIKLEFPQVPKLKSAAKGQKNKATLRPPRLR